MFATGYLLEGCVPLGFGGSVRSERGWPTTHEGSADVPPDLVNRE